MAKVVWLSLFTILFLVGCAGTPVEKPKVSEIQGFADTNKIIDPQKIKQGGGLLIIPFKAGEGVEANEELNKVALMMVKGIAEELSLNSSPFKILTAENADSADLMIKGHVMKMGQTRGPKKWIPGQNAITLKVTGELIDKKTQKRVLVFSQQRMGKQPLEDFKSLGKALGYDIGHFIITAIE